MLKKILFSCTMLMSVMSYAQVSVFNPSVTTDGVCYVLPKTAVKINVNAIKTTFTPGEYAKYAERYLHLSNVKTESETQWEVTDVNVSETGVIDTLKRFSVKSKDKNLLPKIQLSKEGFILAINTDVEKKCERTSKVKTTNNKKDHKKYITEDMLSATSSAKFAELVAQEILDIRESKNVIRRGQAENMPKDGEGVRIVLNELNNQEEALTQLFTGYTDTVYHSQSFSVVPEKDIDKMIVFRFSKRLGFVDSDDLAGEPYFISVKDNHTVSVPNEREAAKRKITGLVFNLPSMADVAVFTGDRQWFNNTLPLAQFGTIDMLSPSLFGKDTTTSVVFDPATGAVSKIK